MAQRYLDLREYQDAQLNNFELFLTQLWREMFSSSSLDAWQPRTSNVRVCLEEILEVIRIGRIFQKYLHNLEPLIEELRRLVSKDPIISTNYPFLKGKEYLGPFLDGRVGEDRLTVFEETVRIVLGNLRGYVTCLVRELNRTLTQEPNAKKQLAALTLALGTEICARGYLPQFLDEHGTKTLLDKNREFADRLTALMTRLDGQRHHYKCIFKTDLNSYMGLRFKDVALLNEHPTVAPENPAAEFYTNATNAVLAEVEANEVDKYAAVVAAEDRLEKLCAAVDLYTPQHAALFQKRKVLVSENGGASEPTMRDTTRNTYWKDAGRAKKAVSKVLEVLDRLSAQDAERLTSFLQYHRLALAADTDEGRLVNLWIALESLVRGHADSIIQAATSVVPPFVAMENVRQHLVAVATYIRQSWRQGYRYPQFQHLLPRSSASRLDPQDLLDILLGPEDHARQLCALCEGHPLVLYRITELHRELRSPKSVANWLRRQHQTVSWQLRRIYRARNTVIHQGACPPGNMHLNQHLHSYMMQTAQRLVRDLRWHDGLFGLDDVIRNRSHLYGHTLRILADEEQSKTVPRSALLEWAILLNSTDADSEPAWPGTKEGDLPPAEDANQEVAQI